MNDAGDAAAAAIAAASRRSSITLRPTHSCFGDSCSEAAQGAVGASGAAVTAAQGVANSGQQRQQQQAEAISQVVFASSMRRRSSNSSLAAGMFGAAAAQPATVVRLSSAALAANEAAATEQQQAVTTTHALLGRSDVHLAHQQQQHMAVQVGPSVADANDAASSCCDTQSDLSALANPLAYADTLRKRMDMHLGAAAAAAAAGPAGAAGAIRHGSEDGAVTPRSAARQLEEFIQGNKPLQQKAGEQARGQLVAEVGRAVGGAFLRSC